MKRHGVFFIFLFSCHIAQAALIKGTLPEFAGETVNVFLIEDYETMEKFISKHRYDWEFLHNGIEGNYLDSLMISGYPTYFVLDEVGETMILDAYDFKPSRDLPKLLK